MLGIRQTRRMWSDFDARRAAAGLNHPNSIAVYDWGVHGGTYFIVTEYVAGATLKKVIQRRGPRPEHEALSISIAAAVASALQAAHERGTVHRDVKPHNVLLDPHGNVKVIDFGIARATAESQLTETGTVLGSVHYASPEQIERGTADARSDLYSLGVVLFELLTGQVPYAGESAAAIEWQQVHAHVPSVRSFRPEVSPRAEAIVRSALAKNPEDGFESAAAMRSALPNADAEPAVPIHSAETAVLSGLSTPPAETTMLPGPSTPPAPPPARPASTPTERQRSAGGLVAALSAAGISLLLAALLFTQGRWPDRLVAQAPANGDRPAGVLGIGATPADASPAALAGSAASPKPKPAPTLPAAAPTSGPSPVATAAPTPQPALQPTPQPPPASSPPPAPTATSPANQALPPSPQATPVPQAALAGEAA